MARNGPYTRPSQYISKRKDPNTLVTAHSAGGTSTPAANPFGSMNTTPQPQQTFAPVGGLIFGAQSESQSFPPANANSNYGSDFNFSVPAANNPFATINPFTNPNGNASFPSGTNGNSAGLFGGGFGQQNGDVSMESPEKKQQTSFIFGGQQQQQPPPAAPIFNFTASQAAGKSSSGPGMFGSQNTPTAATNGMFGGEQKAPQKSVWSEQYWLRICSAPKASIQHQSAVVFFRLHRISPSWCYL